MSKDPSIFLEDIRDSINAINSYVRNMQKSDFINPDMAQDAVIRRLEIIGEAANRLPDHFVRRHSNIP